jgi:acyl-CoA thioesterase I
MIRTILIAWFMLSGVVAAESFDLKKILIVGDSISAAYGINPKTGWVNLLANKITQEKIPYQVINASISGDTTINGVNRLPALLKKYQPEIVVIELGGNDGLRGTQIRIMQANLESMIQQGHANGAKVLLAGMKIPPNYGRRYTQLFHQVYQDLADKYSTPLVPFLLEGVGGQVALMQSDGIHPTAEAQPRIVETVWQKLSQML